MLKVFNDYSAEELELLKKYLEKRYQSKKNNANKLSVVFDIFKECDLACIGCGTNASYKSDIKNLEMLPKKEDIFKALDKINEYKKLKNCDVFINFGGGEPFLRDDIIEILAYASNLFGVNGVGIDTNGTLDNSYELILNACQYVSYVGISINGLEQYHNWWAGVKKVNAFQRSISTLQKLLKHSEYISKIEVSSVATKDNYRELPKLMEILKEIGLENYSVHRAMPVGRMRYHNNLIMTSKEYLELLILLIKKSKEISLDAHLHHSIESIYSTLYLEIDTHLPNKIGNPDLGSSLGIEPDGNLVFDPWCTTGVWKRITAGNMFDDATNLYSLLECNGNSLFDLTNLYTSRNLRCKGCTFPCSGGSRVVAAAEKLNQFEDENVTFNNILDAFTEKDPACPLIYENN